MPGRNHCPTRIDVKSYLSDAVSDSPVHTQSQLHGTGTPTVEKPYTKQAAVIVVPCHFQQTLDQGSGRSRLQLTVRLFHGG